MSQYEDRLLRVIDYIHRNPAGDLSLDALADVAAMSRFHWHRVFRAMTGETCAQAVRRIRLHHAACEIARGDRPVDLIAAGVGYSDRDSFDRAFLAQYGVTPAAFRGRGAPRPILPPRKAATLMYPIEIRETPSRRLIGLPHRGAYFRISEAFARLGVLMQTRELYGQVGPMVGLFYDDMSQVPEAELRSFAALVAPDDLPLPEGLEEVRTPGGDHAILTHRGPYATLSDAYDYLFGTWLPASGREPADAPAYEYYHNDPTDTAPADLLTDIGLPLKPETP